MAANEVFEFFCNDCDGWILLTLNPNLRGLFVVECPQCHRKHPREFKDGNMVMPKEWLGTEVKAMAAETRVAIKRDGSVDGDGRDVIKPLPSCYSKESRLEKLRTSLGATADAWVRSATREVLGEE
jgi:hypothetical protein